jgi:hypothetical protein
MSKVVALSGEAMVGKDSFAAPLVKDGWVRLSFAENLKKMCMWTFNLSEYFVDTQEGKKELLDPQPELNQQTLNKIISWMLRTHEIESVNMDQWKIPKKFSTAREVLQYIGTDVCRAIIDSYHVDVVRKRIERLTDKNIVITDARFPNEREMLKKDFGAALIRIKRPGFTPDVPTGHASETSMGSDNGYDAIVLNDGSLENLFEKAKRYGT